MTDLFFSLASLLHLPSFIVTPVLTVHPLNPKAELGCQMRVGKYSEENRGASPGIVTETV
jgi:hypothetical protein